MARDVAVPFNWWEYETEDEKRQRDAGDFMRVAEERRNKADADLFQRNAGGILDTFHNMANMAMGTADQIGEISRQSSQNIADTLSRTARDTGLSGKADQFGQWAQDRMQDAYSTVEKVPEALDDPVKKTLDFLGQGYQAVDDATKDLPGRNSAGAIREFFGADEAVANQERQWQRSQELIDDGISPAEAAMRSIEEGLGEASTGQLSNYQMDAPRAIGSVVSRGAPKIAPKIAESFAPRLGAVADVAKGVAEDAVAKTLRLLGQDAGPKLGAVADDAGKATSRYYHGTGSDFARPDAAKFDPNGLFGPGYYMTDDPRVAGSGGSGLFGGYAEKQGMVSPHQFDNIQRKIDALEELVANEKSALARGWEDKNNWHQYHKDQLSELKGKIQSGPNVRAIDVPSNLRLLDADAPLVGEELGRVVSTIDRIVGGDSAKFLREVANDPDSPRNGQAIRSAIQTAIDGNGLGSGQGSRDANQVLAAAGYDGIRYKGGQRVPMLDEAGKPIEHTAVVIFPESLGKITNATAGTPGGLLPSVTSGDDPVAKTLQSLGIGAARGAVAQGIAASQEEDATPESIATRAAQGALIGAGNRALRNTMPGLRNADLRTIAKNVGEEYQSWAPKGDQWEKVPEGTMQPPGLEYRMGLGDEGGRYARWPKGSAPQQPSPPTPRTKTDPMAGAAQVIREGAEKIGLNGDEEVLRLRLDKEPPEIREVIRDAVESQDWGREGRRQVIPDEVAQRAADRINLSIDDWIKKARPGLAYSEEQIVAIRNAGAAQARKVWGLSNEIRKTDLSGQTTDMLKAQLAAEGKRLADFLSTVKEPARAESGRGLRAWKFDTREFMTDPNTAIQRIYTRMGGKENVEKAIEEFTKLAQDGAGPLEMAKFWGRVERPPVGFSDWFKTLRYNSMLSGPRSVEVNFIGSAAELPWKLARDAGISIVRGHPEEIVQEVAGIWSGMRRGVNAYMEVLGNGITTEQALRGDLPRDMASRIENPIGRGIATFLELPGRVMNDEFWRATFYGMELGRQSAKQATREGLSGKAWTARVADLQVNPTEPLMKRAEVVADRLTFKGEMGRTGRGVELFAKEAGLVGHLILPFVRTAYHLASRGIERTPIGLVSLGVDVARGAYKNGARKGVASIQDRLGEGIPGTLVSMWLVGEALDGNLSAAGPDDKQKKDMMMVQGWQPYSVKIGNEWVSYANWGPYAMPLALAASLAETQQYKESGAPIENQVLDTLRRMSDVMTEQTYLRGIGTIWKAREDPERYGKQFLTDTLRTLIPYGAALNTVGQATDPFMRRPLNNDFGQTLAVRLPGMREQVPVATDLTGKPIENPQQGIGALNPFRISKEKDDAVLKEMSRVKVDFPIVSPEIAGERLYGKDAQEYRDKAQLYRAQLLSEVMKSPVYTRADDDQKALILKRSINRASAWASQEIRPGAREEGREFLSLALGDVDTATSGYIRALDARRQLDDLKSSRYVGYSGETGEEVASDRNLLAQYKQTLGESRGELAFQSKYGTRRLARAKYARENPTYRNQVESIRRQRPELDVYFGSASRILQEIGAPV